MTAVAVVREAAARRRAAPVLVVAGVAALLARPRVAEVAAHPTAALIVVFVASLEAWVDRARRG